MILTRQGNKRRIAHQIIPYFPKHEVYLEPFFGAGGMFFSKVKSKYNFLNDLDDDVYNLFKVLLNQKEEFKEKIELLVHHHSLFKDWKNAKEQQPILKALRFLYLSSFSYLGFGDIPRYGLGNTKKSILKAIDSTYNLLADCQFLHYEIFIYCVFTLCTVH